MAIATQVTIAQLQQENSELFIKGLSIIADVSYRVCMLHLVATIRDVIGLYHDKP